MGLIGGRKPANGRKEKTKSPEPLSQTGQTTPSHRNPKLGVIGGRQEKSTIPLTPVRDHDSTASPTPSPPPPPSGPPSGGRRAMDAEAVPKRSIDPSKAEEPLTEAERANLKRVELKRQLDQGAGRKKKRRF